MAEPTTTTTFATGRNPRGGRRNEGAGRDCSWSSSSSSSSSDRIDDDAENPRPAVRRLSASGGASVGSLFPTAAAPSSSSSAANHHRVWSSGWDKHEGERQIRKSICRHASTLADDDACGSSVGHVSTGGISLGMYSKSSRRSLRPSSSSEMESSSSSSSSEDSSLDSLYGAVSGVGSASGFGSPHLGGARGGVGVDRTSSEPSGGSAAFPPSLSAAMASAEESRFIRPSAETLDQQGRMAKRRPSLGSLGSYGSNEGRSVRGISGSIGYRFSSDFAGAGAEAVAPKDRPGLSTAGAAGNGSGGGWQSSRRHRPSLDFSIPTFDDRGKREEVTQRQQWQQPISHSNPSPNLIPASTRGGIGAGIGVGGGPIHHHHLPYGIAGAPPPQMRASSFVNVPFGSDTDNDDDDEYGDDMDDDEDTDSSGTGRRLSNAADAAATAVSSSSAAAADVAACSSRHYPRRKYHWGRRRSTAETARRSSSMSVAALSSSSDVPTSGGGATTEKKIARRKTTASKFRWARRVCAAMAAAAAIVVGTMAAVLPPGEGGSIVDAVRKGGEEARAVFVRVIVDGGEEDEEVGSVIDSAYADVAGGDEQVGTRPWRDGPGGGNRKELEVVDLRSVAADDDRSGQRTSYGEGQRDLERMHDAQNGVVQYPNVLPPLHSFNTAEGPKDLGIYVPPHITTNLADLWDVRRDLDIPVLWTIPHTGSDAIHDIMSHCHGMVEASDLGKGNHGILKVRTHPPDNARYVNVDVSSTKGIDRSQRLGLVSSGLVDVAVTNDLYGTARIFDGAGDGIGSAGGGNGGRGRAFAVFRHPVHRAVDAYYYSYSGRAAASKEGGGGMSLLEYARSDGHEDNAVVRSLTGEEDPSKKKGKRGGPEVTARHVEVAKEVVRRKLLVGMSNTLEVSASRFDSYFGWTAGGDGPNGGGRRDLDSDRGAAMCAAERARRAEEELSMTTGGGGGGDRGSETGSSTVVVVDPSSEEYAALASRNWADVQLYHYVKVLFEEQGAALGMAAAQSSAN